MRGLMVPKNTILTTEQIAMKILLEHFFWAKKCQYVHIQII